VRLGIDASDLTLTLANGVEVTIQGGGQTPKNSAPTDDPFDYDPFADEEHLPPHPGTAEFDSLPEDEQRRLLLRHYSGRPIERFEHHDAFINAQADDLVTPDADGDWLISGQSTEFLGEGWHGDVRILIRGGVSKAAAVRVMRKTANWIEAHGLHCDRQDAEGENA